MWDDVEIGDIFRLADDGIVGVITNIYEDEYNDPVSLVVKDFDGSWVAINLSNCIRTKPQLQ